MKNNEKMWYSMKEAANYLNMEENKLGRKIMGLNIETKRLPGQRGEFLSRKDLLDLEMMGQPPAPR